MARPTTSVDAPFLLDTTIGSLRGIEQRERTTGKSVLYRFLKIPYARAPVGPLRWRRPQPFGPDFSFNTPAGQPGDYTSFGPICPQPHYDHGLAYVENPNEAVPIQNVEDEDCLYLNIWVPSSMPTPSPAGWPVQFHLHGGWLQVGSANQLHDHDPFDLLADRFNGGTARILVVPTYRLNVFGFLAGQELATVNEDAAPANYGFWDQRAALEWTAKHIHHFNGNAGNIAVGGLSAGANSTLFQLHYDSRMPLEKRLIRRVYLWSNAVSIQPDASTSSHLSAQFDQLCSVLNIQTPSSSSASSPGSLSLTVARYRLERLRLVPAAELVVAIRKLDRHMFRASTDGDFVPRTFLASLHSGAFTTRLAEAGVSVLLGEVADEKQLYKLVNPPANRDDLMRQLNNYYPQAVVDHFLPLYSDLVPNGGSEKNDKPEVWAEAFSQMVADHQVHASLRGLTHILLRPPPPGVESKEMRSLRPDQVYRYRISWRARALDAWLKPEVGVAHASDIPIWWLSGWRMDFTSDDKAKTRKFLVPFGQFLAGAPISWGGSSAPGTGRSAEEQERRYRWLDPDGNVREDVEDDLYDRGLQLWNAAWDAQKGMVALE